MIPDPLRPEPDASPERSTRGLVRRLGAPLFTGLVVLLSAAAVFAGSLLIAVRADSRPAPPPVATPVVETTLLTLRDGFTLERRFVGQVEAARSVVLTFESGGTLDDVRVDDGDSVAAGDVIARLDTRLLRAERRRHQAARRALEAQLTLARRTAERRDSLRAKGFVSGQQADQDGASVAELTARIAEVDAALLAVAIRLEKAVLLAPFDARVTSRHLDPGATAGPGQAVVSIVEARPPRFRAGVDPALAASLTAGQTMAVTFGGDAVAARFVALMPELNPATRSHDALFAFEAGSVPVLPGATGTITLSQQVAGTGAWVPVSALRAGLRGTWEIMTVIEADDGPRIGLEAVQILHADAERAFVTGTFAPDASIVSRGVHRVVKGQRVRPTPAELARDDHVRREAI